LKFKILLQSKFELNLEFFQFISRSLRKFEQIKELSLDFGNNLLSSPAMKHILIGLENSSGILKLKICFKAWCINKNVYEGLIKAIGKMSELRSLKISLPDCGLEDASVIAFSRELERMSSLRKLAINFDQSNLIFCKSIEELARALFSLHNLQKLHISLKSNALGEREINALSKSIATLADLRNLQLNLQNNKVSDSDARSLWTSINSLPKLAFLNLGLENNEIKDISLTNLSQRDIKIVG
jgi:hypothetical protein